MSAPVMVADAYAAAFDAAGGDQTVPAAVRALRRVAFDRFAALGFPTPKNEDWHYTSVAAIADQEFALLSSRTGDVGRDDLAPFDFGAHDWHTIAFVNGRFAPELSDLKKLPAGVEVSDLATAWASGDVADRLGSVASHQSHAFTALNAAFAQDGAVVRIARNVEVARPIHLLFVTDAAAARAMTHPRNLIVVERNATATVIETYASATDSIYFTNAVTEVTLGDGASLRHYKMQREAPRAYHVGTIEVEQRRDSHYVSFSLATGAELSRTNVSTTLDGEGSGATLNGLYMLDGEQHCDHQTQIIHAQPNTFSRELYKGILDGRSHGVFNGKVYVRPIAQKTDGKQTNKTLLLSDTAHVDTKPQLEIFADDVKCTHGATVGQIDQAALFYLKSRGIANKLARRLLTYAFAADVLETIEVDAVREGLERTTLERFV
ncbi:MAG TPA: Fe-S cluster assembly protein SufD [Gemmatimonadaceae bacterium]